MKNSSSGFTLVEVLISMVILAIGVAGSIKYIGEDRLYIQNKIRIKIQSELLEHIEIKMANHNQINSEEQIYFKSIQRSLLVESITNQTRFDEYVEYCTRFNLRFKKSSRVLDSKLSCFYE